jgi:hypothetical protein
MRVRKVKFDSFVWGLKSHIKQGLGGLKHFLVLDTFLMYEF